jgi:CubicO group peptidase (beta-lactamase class C family)
MLIRLSSPKFLKAIFLFLIVCSSGFAQNITKADLNAIDSVMKSYYRPEEPGTSIVVAKDGKIVFSKGYGMANLEQHTPISTASVLRMGSMTKQFTAIAILMLVQKGQLSLDDRLSKFYQEQFKDDHGITIRHLLGHTSGIKDYITIPEVRAYATRKIKPQDIIAIIAQSPLDFEPGTDYTYSNSGYFILGGILEQITGVPYPEFITKNILQPLKMQHTSYEDPAQIIADRASGYYRRAEGFINAPYIDMSVIFSAGALLTNPEDMVKWDESLYLHSLVNAQYIKMAMEPQQLHNGDHTDYGFGFRMAKVNGVNSIEHGGGIFGFQCYGIRVESAHVYVLVMTNFEGKNKYDVACAQAAAIAIGKSYSQNKYLTMSKAELADYTGRFTGKDRLIRSIFVKKDSLFYQDDKVITQLIPMSRDTFKMDGTFDDRITFFRKNKKITAIEVKPRRQIGIMMPIVKD